jgi:hypothetical protein
LPNPQLRDADKAQKKMERQNPLLTEFVLNSKLFVANPIVKRRGVMPFQISF